METQTPCVVIFEVSQLLQTEREAGVVCSGIPRVTMELLSRMLNDPRFEVVLTNSIPALAKWMPDLLANLPQLQKCRVLNTPAPRPFGHLCRKPFLLLFRILLSCGRPGARFMDRLAPLVMSVWSWGERPLPLPEAWRGRKVCYFSPFEEIPPAIRRQKAILSVGMIHDLIPMYWRWNIPVESWRYSLIFRSLARTAHILLFVSQATAAEFNRLFPKSKAYTVQVFPAAAAHFVPAPEHEVRQLRAHYNISPEKQYVLMVASVGLRKPVDVCARAFLKLALPDAVLVIAGRGGLENRELQLLAAEYPDRIRCIGMVPDRELPVLYSGALFFMLISHCEGFGLPVVEAMCCGTPVLSSHNSSLIEVGGDAVLFTPDNTEESIAEAMRTMYDDPQLRQRLVEAGFRQAQRFSWERSYQLFAETLLVAEVKP